MVKKRMALIVPSSNTTMEADFVPRIPDKYSFHVGRMYTGEPASKATEEYMITVGLDTAMRDLATAKVDLVIFGCTSGGTIHGTDTQTELEEKITKITGARSMTVTRAMTVMLDRAGAKKMLLYTPYVPELHQSVTDFMTGKGYEIIHSKGMAKQENQWIAAVEPEEFVEFVMSDLLACDLLEMGEDGRYTLKDGDGIFISCTNLRGWEAKEILEKKINTFIATSNQVTFDYAIEIMNTL